MLNNSLTPSYSSCFHQCNFYSKSFKLSKSDSTHNKFLFLRMFCTSQFYNTMYKNILRTLWPSYMWLDNIYKDCWYAKRAMIIPLWDFFVCCSACGRWGSWAEYLKSRLVQHTGTSLSELLCLAMFQNLYLADYSDYRWWYICSITNRLHSSLRKWLKGGRDPNSIPQLLPESSYCTKTVIVHIMLFII